MGRADRVDRVGPPGGPGGRGGASDSQSQSASSDSDSSSSSGSSSTNSSSSSDSSSSNSTINLLQDFLKLLRELDHDHGELRGQRPNDQRQLRVGRQLPELKTSELAPRRPKLALLAAAALRAVAAFIFTALEHDPKKACPRT